MSNFFKNNIFLTKNQKKTNKKKTANKNSIGKKVKNFCLFITHISCLVWNIFRTVKRLESFLLSVCSSGFLGRNATYFVLLF